MPCADTIQENSETQASFSQVADADHDHSSQDLCSPFCHCHCCHVHSINFELIVFEPFNGFISNEILGNFKKQGKDIQISLFQPPQA